MGTAKKKQKKTRISPVLVKWLQYLIDWFLALWNMVRFLDPVNYDWDDPFKNHENLIDVLEKKFGENYIPEKNILMNIYCYTKEDYHLKYHQKERFMESKCSWTVNVLLDTF